MQLGLYEIAFHFLLVLYFIKEYCNSYYLKQYMILLNHIIQHSHVIDQAAFI